MEIKITKQEEVELVTKILLENGFVVKHKKVEDKIVIEVNVDFTINYPQTTQFWHGVYPYGYTPYGTVWSSNNGIYYSNAIGVANSASLSSNTIDSRCGNLTAKGISY